MNTRRGEFIVCQFHPLVTTTSPTKADENYCNGLESNQQPPFLLVRICHRPENPANQDSNAQNGQADVGHGKGSRNSENQ